MVVTPGNNAAVQPDWLARVLQHMFVRQPQYFIYLRNIVPSVSVTRPFCCEDGRAVADEMHCRIRLFGALCRVSGAILRLHGATKHACNMFLPTCTICHAACCRSSMLIRCN